MENDPHQPATADHHLRQAHAYEEQQDYQRALAESDAAIALGQSFLADAHNLRAVVLEELGRNEDAIQAYSVALRLDPGCREVAENLLELERELGMGRDLVTIATYSHPTEAHILKTKLESEGIWSYVADEAIVTMNWLYSNAVGGVKLKVREPDVDRALEILGIALEDGEHFEDELDDQELLSCPNCGSHYIRYEKYATRVIFASWLLLGFPLVFLKRKWKCEECGHVWKQGAKEERLDDLVALEEQATSHPNDVEYIYDLADVYARRERWDDAIQAYKTAIALDPLSADLHNCLGVACEQAGQAEQAEQAYRQAIQLEPKDAMFYYNLGTLCEAQQRTAGAIQAFKECLQYSNDPDERSEVKERLERLGS